MAEVDAEGAVAMVHNLACDQQVEFDGLDVGVEVPPAKHLLELPRLDHRPSFSSWPRVLQLCRVPQPVPQVLLRVWLRGVIAKVQSCAVLLALQSL